jgi:8-oxo-dGTP diphosphatase
MVKVNEAFPEFEKPSIAIDTVIIRVKNTIEESNRQVSPKKMQVLLISDKNENEGDKEWYLPGTILRLGETPKDAIDRVLENKTHLSDAYFEQLYTVADNPLRDARGHIISIVYIGIVNSIDNIKINDSSRYNFEWAWIEKKDKSQERYMRLESSDKIIKKLKYDHTNIINDTIKRLQGKLMYSELGFSFVNKEFTIKELENSFIAINERDIPGFRRIISNKIEGTGIMSDGKAFRPAELYRKKVKAHE